MHQLVYTRSGKGRASMMMFFVVCLLPVFMLSLAVAFDWTRVEVAHRQLDTATNSAAIAAAWGTDKNQKDTITPTINLEEMQATALADYCRSWVRSVSAASLPLREKPSKYTDCPDPAGLATLPGSTASQMRDFSLTTTLSDSTGGVGAPGAVKSKVTVVGEAKVTGLMFFQFLLNLLNGEDGSEVTINATSSAEICHEDPAIDILPGDSRACPRPINR